MKNLIAKSNFIIPLFILMLAGFPSFSTFAEPPNEYIVPLCRQFSKDLFDLNVQPYLSSTLQVVNSTSNAGFFHSAYIPRKVDKPYFRLSGNFMLGFVRDDMKTFSPQIPTQEFDMAKLASYAEINVLDFSKTRITDTAGLINYYFQTILHTGIYVDKTINVPSLSATTLGKTGSVLQMDSETLQKILEKDFVYQLIVASMPELAAQMNQIFQTEFYFILPNGGDLNTIAAGVPQLEVGSLFGTELLIRYVPKIDLGEWIGKFTFWGVGLKHSISQYFYKDNNRDGNAPNRDELAPFDLAAQIVFQGTSLENTVGITASKLNANANIIDFNLHFSKNFDNMFEIYSGFSYEYIKIDGSYKYYLPVELQARIGLMTWERPDEDTDKGAIITDHENGFPGDNVVQQTDVSLTENQFKWTIGASKNIGPVTLFIDYSTSKFNIFSGGLQYRF